MSGPRVPSRRSSAYAWLVTAPLALFGFTCFVISLRADERWHQAWLGGVVLLIGAVLANVTVTHIVIGRQSYNMVITEIPLVLGLYFVPPASFIAAMTAAALVTNVRSMESTKLWFNVARQAASSSAALVVIALLPDITGPGPTTWVILFFAVMTSVVVSHVAVAGVIALVQSRHAGRQALTAGMPTLAIAAINIIIGLVFLIAIEANRWAVVLLAALVLAMILVFRSFAGIFRQHRTLTEVYELTVALRDETGTGGLPDVLLGRVRTLMRSEFATLWLPVQGRHPEVLLTSRVDDNAALFDISPTPSVLRDRVMETGRAVSVGSEFDETADLRDLLRAKRLRDIVAVPLRSGQITIGTLEVVNRLGSYTTFRDADVQVLETIAAHVAGAVENSRLVDRLRYDAYHDRLTALPNRRRIIDALAESVTVRAEDEVVAILLFDVDGQRNVNESMGHAAGDKLLVEVAERIRGIADSGALVGRIGGDEFVVTLRTASIEATIELATQMRERLRGPMAVGTLTLDVDTAVGVSVYPDHGSDPETLLQRAELAANAAKVLPYGVQPFHPALESRAVRRLGIAADLRRAIDNDQLEVYFQPKVTLADRHVLGVECLARWVHPAHGEVAPEDFVAVAEHTGQLARLTEVVLTAGLRHCKAWADADRPLSIAVNLSARTLLDSRFPDLVQELLEEHRVEPGQVTFEISEPGMLSDIERVLPTLYRLRDLGVRLSVDDFGTGASSLGYLRQWPVHEVKIDDTFVQGMATDSGDLAIVRAIVSLAREFGLTVVAEGVESELTLELLEEMGCEIGQGYLFSRPLPFERLEAWLSAQTEPESTPTGEVRRLRAVI
ncbi:bifunctional diguanylate cyclase/phosphodiesterase [Actinoplanes ianthinogenes]|uniref:Bifunctional diguanylate cyclase/phosphodiesterase n=1 Tax=Actinoplanes ianthinogenes TaxID=122358 RepID=A0ABN6CFL0_9ACTN|nr:bifunctional diguanylate cyclase/phosphodiesterase [Actinoplanes ianthinogenes]BCJ44267.1 bifunctional diguanylate cyclase/phosphodiesterase [Actinoplanes ianthinogenes]GGQ96928.1 bifunctional diguanylate cyclase/phosphodiesterase [Actinoplanes ianthinogenes]